MLDAVYDIFRLELKAALRQKGDYCHPIFFFLLIVLLFPLATVPEGRALQVFAPGIIWVAALMASVLGLQVLFRTDADSGFLDKLLLNDRNFLS